MAGQRRNVEWNEAEWREGIAKAIKETSIKTEKQLAAVGLEIQNAARNFSPVDTGRLRSSIASTGVLQDKKGAYVQIGTNVVYAGPVEFGTNRMEPQPYLRPAFLEGLQIYNKKMKEIK